MKSKCFGKVKEWVAGLKETIGEGRAVNVQELQSQMRLLGTGEVFGGFRGYSTHILSVLSSRNMQPYGHG